jgi:hypothetical protein
MKKFDALQEQTRGYLSGTVPIRAVHYLIIIEVGERVSSNGTFMHDFGFASIAKERHPFAAVGDFSNRDAPWLSAALAGR